MSKNGDVVEDVISRVNEGAKVSGALSRIWKAGSFGMGIKRMVYERIVELTVVYVAKAWLVFEGEGEEERDISLLATRKLLQFLR